MVKGIVSAATIILLFSNISCQSKGNTESTLIGSTINSSDYPVMLSATKDGKEYKYQLYLAGSYENIKNWETSGNCYIEETQEDNRSPIVLLTDAQSKITDTLHIHDLKFEESFSFGILLFNGKEYVEDFEDPNLSDYAKYGLIRYTFNPTDYTQNISKAWTVDNETMKFIPIEVTSNLRLMDEGPGCNPDQDM